MGNAPHAAAGITRRWVGIAVLVGVLVVVVVVAAVRGRVLAGDPTARPVDAAPLVGDCVTENPHDRGADLYTWTTAPPALRTQPCTGPRFGEVVAVDGDHATTATAVDTAALACIRQADEYLGIPPRVAFDPNTAGPVPPREASFRPSADVLVALTGPDTRQQAAGQAWTACIAYLPVSTDAHAPVTVDHPLQGAWNRAGDSHLFALCLDDTASLVGANCRWPHRFEVIGMQWGNPKISQNAWDAACRQAVTRALGSSAALDRGELTTQVVAARPDRTAEAP